MALQRTHGQWNQERKASEELQDGGESGEEEAEAAHHVLPERVWI